MVTQSKVGGETDALWMEGRSNLCEERSLMGICFSITLQKPDGLPVTALGHCSGALSILNAPAWVKGVLEALLLFFMEVLFLRSKSKWSGLIPQ